MGVITRVQPLAILVIDGHEESARAMTGLLQGEGHSVTLASGFADALAAAALMGPIDLIVCDVALPDGHGCALLRLLRERRDGPPRHAIALTGHSGDGWLQEYQRAGYQRSLPKPVVFADLLVAVRLCRPWPRPGARDTDAG